MWVYTSNPLSAYDMINTIKREILHFLHSMIYCCPQSPACDYHHLHRQIFENFVIWQNDLVFCELICSSHCFHLCLFWVVVFSATATAPTPFVVFHIEDHFSIKQSMCWYWNFFLILWQISYLWHLVCRFSPYTRAHA